MASSKRPNGRANFDAEATAFIEVGEYGLALGEILGILAQNTIAITGQERRDMLALAAGMNLDGGLLPRALTACPEADGSERRSV